MNDTYRLRVFRGRLSLLAENRQKVLSRINKLIKETVREPFRGPGKPEPLKHNLAGYLSRRISSEDRMAYKVMNDSLLTAQLRYHY